MYSTHPTPPVPEGVGVGCPLHSPMPADAVSYTTSNCGRCGYPFTPSSRDRHDQLVCPECGHRFEVYAFTVEQLRRIAEGDAASRRRGVRSVALAGFMGLTLIAHMLAPYNRFDLHTLYLLAGFALLVHTIVQLQSRAALRAFHAPYPFALSCALALCMLSLVLSMALSGPSLTGYLGLIYVQLPLFVGVITYLRETRWRARVFPIEHARAEAQRFARRALALMVTAALVYNALTLVITPRQEQAWVTLMAMTVGSCTVAISMNTRAMESLHTAARPWLSPTRVDLDA
jgi:DNA-directed RNA polymerase subunit RPC12/RpoP